MNVEAIAARLNAYFETCSYPVTVAYLFGSSVRDQATSLSDVDVAIHLAEPQPSLRARMYLSLLFELAEHAGTEEIDLVYLNEASPLLGHQIFKTGRPVYVGDEKERVRIETDFLGRYFDEQELFEVRHRYLRRRILAARMGEGGKDMVEEEVVNERLRHIEEMLGFLKRYAALSLEEFKADREKSHAALYELQTCIEAMTDIGNHLVAALNLRKPEDRADIMLVLAEGGIIPEELARSLIRAIGLRNVIVHGYLGLALDIVYQSLRDDLSDVEDYCRHVVQYLGQQCRAPFNP